MIKRHAHKRANIITHIHTVGSNAEASALDDLIGPALKRLDGEDTAISWSECFTPIQSIQKLVQQGRGGHGPVHMVLVTDHMRARSHSHPDTHLDAAARDHRIALGAELATNTRDVDGEYRQGPEILAHGGPEKVEGPHGPYYGLSRRLLEELYDTCTDHKGEDLCTRRTRDLLRRRNIAHALSHPYDGHFLSFEGMFAIISEFSFVEALNGGYFAESTRVLEAFIRFNNAIVRGAFLPSSVMTPLTRRIVSHIRDHGRLICPWSGSDAHSHDFDRVVLSMACKSGTTPQSLRPGQFFKAMLGAAEEQVAEVQDPGSHPAQQMPLFANIGKPGTPLSQTTDITAIVLRNFSRVCRTVSSPLTLARIASATYTVTAGELRGRKQWQTDRQKQLRSEFNPITLLPWLQLPTGQRKARRTGHLMSVA